MVFSTNPLHHLHFGQTLVILEHNYHAFFFFHQMANAAQCYLEEMGWSPDSSCVLLQSLLITVTYIIALMNSTTEDI